jgi:hypothetical protein
MPEATYFFEPPIMKYYARLIYEGRVSFPQVRRFYHLGFRSLLLAAPGSGPRIVEKNPNHTWVAETLLAVFPTAQFVVIVRDGRDTALSLSEQPWHQRDSLGSGKREPGGYSYGPYPHFYIEPERAGEFATTSDFHRCVWIWRRHTEEIERLRNALPSRSWHELRYETLIEEPNEVLDELLSFLGEETTVARRALHDAARSEHRRSIGRWRSHLTREDLAVVAAEAGPLLRRLGYS